MATAGGSGATAGGVVGSFAGATAGVSASDSGAATGVGSVSLIVGGMKKGESRCTHRSAQVPKFRGWVVRPQ